MQNLKNVYPDGAVRHADIVVVSVGDSAIAVEPLQAYQPARKAGEGKKGRGA